MVFKTVFYSKTNNLVNRMKITYKQTYTALSQNCKYHTVHFTQAPGAGAPRLLRSL